MAKHTNDCGKLYPRGCRPNCNCWCHNNMKAVKSGKNTFRFEELNTTQKEK